jgi:FHA domain
MTLPEDPTAPLDLVRFGADARALGEEDFAARHGLAFLLHHGNLDPTRKPAQPQPTMVMGRGMLPSDAAPFEGPGRKRSDSFNAMGALRVYPVKHTGRSPFPRIVTVGRTKNNDIVLADISISKFHAFFKEEGGQFFLADGESRNGTFVENDRALPTKQGKPTPLKTGVRVKFGAVEFRFIDVKELLVLARQFG